MKEDIAREKIKASLYDEINIFVDYTGLTDRDVLESASIIDELMKDKGYNKYITPLNYFEIEEYALRQRREISLASKRNSIEEDNTIRYVRSDVMTEVIVYRSFLQIRLRYDENARHVLREYFVLLNNIVKCLRENKDFFKLQTVFLQKKNEIYCKSLYQVFRCFDRNMFGTFMYGSSKDPYSLNILQAKENFFCDDLEFDVLKAVSNGRDGNTNKDIYLGQFDITGRYDAAPIDNVDIVAYLGKINDQIFDIFRRYLTDGFLKDMVEGKTVKLIGGFQT